jgi:hypothetical protein
MGFMLATGECMRCHKLFSFNPNLVPSVTVNGFRKPICADCVAWANPIRVANGLAAIQILPGAYEAQEVD